MRRRLIVAGMVAPFALSAALASAEPFWAGPALVQNDVGFAVQGPGLATNAGVFYGNTVRIGTYFSVAFVWTTDGAAAKPMSDYTNLAPGLADPPNISEVRQVDVRSGVGYGQSGHWNYTELRPYTQLAPARWSPGRSPARTVLNDLPNTYIDDSFYYPYVTAVNAAGGAVGFTNTRDTAEHVAERAVRWTAGSTAATELLPLQRPPDGMLTFAEASDVNTAGVAVGWSTANDGVHADSPVRWDAGGVVAIPLGQAAGFDAYPRYINDAGLIAGVAERDFGGGRETRAIRWTAGSAAPQFLPSAHADDPARIHYDQATDLNERGQIAGESAMFDPNTHFNVGSRAVVWEADGSLRTLPLPSVPAGQHLESAATRINAIGAAIGTVDSFQDGNDVPFLRRGTVWTPDGGIIDLNTLLPAGWSNCNAVGEITDTGFVTAIAWIDSGDGLRPRQFAVLVPRAGTYGWGDADLNARIDFSDLLVLAKHYNQPNLTKAINVGDFNLDGSSNFTDLLALAKHYNVSAYDNLASAGFDAAFASEWALARALVPEPSTLLLLATTFVGRRRRR